MYDFDYNDFKKELAFSADVPINRAGIPVKPDSTVFIEDPNTGEILELDMNEISDKYVNMIFTPKNYRDVYKYQALANEQMAIQSMYLNPGRGISITLERPHNFKDDSVFEGVISGANEDGFNGTWEITARTSYILTIGERTVTDSSTIIATGAMFVSKKESYDKSKLYLWGDEVPIDDKALINTRNMYFGVDNKQPPILTSVGILPSGELHDYNIPVTPRHLLMTDEPIPGTGIPFSNTENRSLQIDREIFAALGLWSNNNYSITPTMKYNNGDYKNVMGIPDYIATGYIDKKEFEARLTELSAKLAPLNIAIRPPKIYDEYTVDGSDGKPFDINDSHIKAKQGRRKVPFSYVQHMGMGTTRYSRVNNFKGIKTIDNAGFIEKKAYGYPELNVEGDDDVLPRESGEVSPFTLSVKEVVKAQYSASELNNELGESILEIFDRLKEVPNSSDAFEEVIEELKENEFITEVPVWEISSVTGLEDKTRPVYKVDPSLVGSKKNPEGYVLKTGASDPNVQAIADKTKGKFFYTNRIQETIHVVNLENTNLKMRDLIKQLQNALGKIKKSGRSKKFPSFGFMFSFGIVFEIQALNSAISHFDDVVKKIKWYERYTNESIFENKDFISSARERSFKRADRMMARVLVPVHLGIKIKKGKKRWRGWRRYLDYKKIDMGVRWVQVEFVDVSVFEKYRKNEIPSGEKLNGLDISVTPSTSIDDNKIILTSNGLDLLSLEPRLEGKNIAGVIVSGAIGTNKQKYNGTFKAQWEDNPADTNNPPMRISYILNGDDEITETPTGDIRINSFIVDLEPAKGDGEPEQLDITFNMPNLPSDTAIRKKAFAMYGQFEQVKGFLRVEEDEYLEDFRVEDNFGNIFNTDNVPNGYEIFQDSSKNIEDMRKGLDIYNKVQFLLQILKEEFSAHRVKLVETVRSLKDQDILQLGGEESSFLSWHNYGLAVKILITEKDGKNLILRGSDDFFKLLDIAEPFIEAARLGKFGRPANVVWCEQLVIGSDMFVWEFLPIGVGHRSARHFREAIFNQQDPVITRAYVNVTELGYIIEDEDPIPDGPYIRRKSLTNDRSITINDEVWAPPKLVKKYRPPRNLVLKDIQEFLYLIENKFKAHGTDLMTDMRVTQWKQQNPISFKQLVMYNALTGNFAIVRALLAIGFIDEYKIKIYSLAQANPVEFVKQILGTSEYENIKISLRDSPDGSYITLHNGKITIPLSDARSTLPPGSGNIFGEKKTEDQDIELGHYDNNDLFVSEDDAPIPTITSDEPVIDGYSFEGLPVDGNALFLHVLVKSQILAEIDRIKSLYENLKTKFLYDHFTNSPNKSFIGALENEFGIIKTQTLTEIFGIIKTQTLTEIERTSDIINTDVINVITRISHGFDVLPIQLIRDMHIKKIVNKNAPISSITNKRLGIGVAEKETPENEVDNDPNENQSVYEKLISTAQLNGVQLARLTKEKPVIEPLQNNATVERVMKYIENGNIKVPDVRDIL